MENSLDKMFLLTYTAKAEDGFPRFYHAWFRTEEEMRTFMQEEKARGREPEADLAIEVLEYRSVDL